MNKTIAILLLVIIIIMTSFSSGCFEPSPDSNWNDLISSYDSKKREFVDYEDSVLIGDEVVSRQYHSSDKVTEFILKSNPEVSVYLSETRDKNPDNGDLTQDYVTEDNIEFIVNIREDEYGEYIVQMTK